MEIMQMQRMNKYYEQAVACVKDHVLPAQCKLYEKCGGNFDVIYGEDNEKIDKEIKNVSRRRYDSRIV